MSMRARACTRVTQEHIDIDGCEEQGDCHDCANPTPSCNGGSCGPCQTDADCCPPLLCDRGPCKAIEPG